jgi:putative peptidoglycan lipid II flippase
MNHHLNKQAILKHTMRVGFLTFLSRIFGLIRDILIARFFGVGAIADAFFTAIRIPNFFRSIFGEGAMSASFVPAFVKTVKDDNKEVTHGLMSISFLFFEGIVLLLYILVLLKTNWVITCIAPGFSQEQVDYAVPFLRILFPFLLFISSSALLSGALQSVNHFFTPALGPVLWNTVYIFSLALALRFQLSPKVVCYGCLMGGLVQALANLYIYFKYNFNFGTITSNVIPVFKNVLGKFLPCLFGVSIVELNLFIGTIVASFLPKGSISLLYYGSRFMNIPLGVFAVALSSILLPHFSRLVLYAPRRLNFYILEVVKLVSWVIIPFTLLFMFTSRQLFATILFSKHGSLEHIEQAGWILVLYLSGLLFFCLNKILLSVFYSLKDTKTTTIVTMISALVNLFGDIIGMTIWGAYGIAGSAAVSGVTLTLLCFLFLKRRHQVRFYSGNYFNFLGRYCVQILIAGVLFIVSYFTIMSYLSTSAWYNFFAHRFGYWGIICPLAGLVFALLFLTRDLFGVNLYFLNK